MNAYNVVEQAVVKWTQTCCCRITTPECERAECAWIELTSLEIRFWPCERLCSESWMLGITCCICMGGCDSDGRYGESDEAWSATCACGKVYTRSQLDAEMGVGEYSVRQVQTCRGRSDTCACMTALPLSLQFDQWPAWTPKPTPWPLYVSR